MQAADPPRRIDSQDKIQVTVTVGDNVTALSSTRIKILCITSGLPRPSITWTKNDKEISDNVRLAVGEDGSLLIYEAQIDDTAQYTCTGRNIAGQDSAWSMVHVNGRLLVLLL